MKNKNKETPPIMQWTVEKVIKELSKYKKNTPVKIDFGDGTVTGDIYIEGNDEEVIFG